MHCSTRATIMESCSVFLATTLILSFLAVYKYLTRNNEYWRSRGIPEAEGSVLGFGHGLDQALSRKNPGMLIRDIYKAHPHASMVGMYIGQVPVLIVRHPELVKFVLTTGFSHFSDNPTLDKKIDPLMSHDPFFQNGQEWKTSRGIFLSAFSSKKLKDRMPAIRDTCEKLLDYLKKKSVKGGSIEVEVKSLFSKYTLGVAASAVLSIEEHTFADNVQPHSLREMMNAVFAEKSGFRLKENLQLLFPALSRFFTSRYLPEWVNTFFTNTIHDIRSAREQDATLRNDVLHHISNHLKEKGLDEGELAGHAFGFLLELYETSSLTLSFMCYFAARDPAVQDKMRQEVDDVMRKHGTICSYEAINEMTYIEQSLKESLRLLPPIASMMRLCCKPVTLKGPDGLTCTLKQGDQLRIPLWGLQVDPQYWENPEAFVPERFSKDCEEQREKFVYLPFGEGPRTCPGIRMTHLQVKAAMAALLKDYIIERSERMKEPAEVDPKYFVTAIDGGVWVHLKMRHLRASP